MPLFGKGDKRDDLSSVVNSAKTLLANIRFMSVDNPVRTIAVTSAVPSEGKTFVAANLASAIATSGRTVLLVECDMRRRSLAHTLEIHAQHGLYSVLSGEVALTTAAVGTNTPNLYFLDAEPHIPSPSDLLNSHRFARLIELASHTFEYVVFDTPPVGTFVDAAVLGTKVDAVLMVVREGFTKKEDVVAAADQLKKSGCNLAGVVMNYCERSSSEYYYEYYAKDGHRDEHAPTASSISPEPVRPTPERPARKVGLPQRPERRGRASGAHPAPAEQPSAQDVPAAPSHTGDASTYSTDMWASLASASPSSGASADLGPAAQVSPADARRTPLSHVPTIRPDEEY